MFLSVFKVLLLLWGKKKEGQLWYEESVLGKGEGAQNNKVTRATAAN